LTADTKSSVVTAHDAVVTTSSTSLRISLLGLQVVVKSKSVDLIISLVYEDLKDWEDNLLTPVFNNCFLYLKTNSRIVIDIKELYTNSILNTLEKSGFKIVEIENYNVRKSHYTKKNTKKQLLIHAVKI
jgi:tRNA(Phe) wybutosine-synthesizing methylase Tyw3